jgi:sugar transferase (PEP-CTERM/EpsH1 system associated)
MHKRILFLTPQLPFPPQQGTALRNYNLIAQVSRQHEVHLLSFHDAHGVADDVGPLRRLCASLETVPTPTRSNWQRLRTLVASRSPDMAHRLASALYREKLSSLMRALQPDVVQAEGLEMAEYGMQARQPEDGPVLVFDAHNAEYLLQRRIFETDAPHPDRWLGALYSLIQWQRLRRYEALACRSADRVIACSDADAQALTLLALGLQPIVVPNGVDTQVYRPGIVPPAALRGRPLVFTGKMDFRPNVDAVLWFCSQALPLIRDRIPEARLYVVGKNPHPRLARLARGDGVTLTGFVQDVRPYVAAAEVCVAPLLTGGGTRLKVLEAMAMGKPIVSTALGCEGIRVTSGREVVLAESAIDFAAQAIALLEDAERRNALGQAARAFVEQYFDWQTVAAPLEQAYER